MQWGGVRQGAGTEEVRKGELGGGLGWARRGGQRAMQSSPGGPGDRCLPLLALNTCVNESGSRFLPTWTIQTSFYFRVSPFLSCLANSMSGQTCGPNALVSWLQSAGPWSAAVTACGHEHIQPGSWLLARRVGVSWASRDRRGQPLGCTGEPGSHRMCGKEGQVAGVSPGVIEMRRKG